MNIIITMAGYGKRFLDAGYKEPKYQIKVCGHPLLYWAVSSLQNFVNSDNLFVFVGRKENNVSQSVRRECSIIGIENFEILELVAPTDGQATTALCAGDIITDIDEPIIVYNIDTYVDPDYLKPENIRGHGWLPCFPGKGNHWSFARIGRDGKVVMVREKMRISSHATIGLYYFNSYGLYKRVYEEFYSVSTNIEFGEKYIAPLYNQLITNNMSVYIDQIPLKAVHGLGTPEEVNLFSLEC